MSTESTTTRREFLFEATASAFAVRALARDVLGSQQPAAQPTGPSEDDPAWLGLADRKSVV